MIQKVDFINEVNPCAGLHRALTGGYYLVERIYSYSYISLEIRFDLQTCTGLSEDFRKLYTPDGLT